MKTLEDFKNTLNYIKTNTEFINEIIINAKNKVLFIYECGSSLTGVIDSASNIDLIVITDGDEIQDNLMIYGCYNGINITWSYKSLSFIFKFNTTYAVGNRFYYSIWLGTFLYPLTEDNFVYIDENYYHIVKNIIKNKNEIIYYSYYKLLREKKSDIESWVNLEDLTDLLSSNKNIYRFIVSYIFKSNRNLSNSETEKLTRIKRCGKYYQITEEELKYTKFYLDKIYDDTKNIPDNIDEKELDLYEKIVSA